MHYYRTFVWKAALVAGVRTGGLWTATQGAAGVAWADVGLVLGRVTACNLALLSEIWLLAGRRSVEVAA